MVPGRCLCGSDVLAATVTLAPSWAARSAMARPMPREAPVTKRVLPERLIGSAPLGDLAEIGRAAFAESGESLGRLGGAQALGEVLALQVHQGRDRLAVAHQRLGDLQRPRRLAGQRR